MASHAKLIVLFVAACFLVIGFADDNGVIAPVNKIMIEARDGQISTVTITDSDCSGTPIPVPMTPPASEITGVPSVPQQSTVPVETPTTSEVPVPSTLSGSSPTPAGPVETRPPGTGPAGGGTSVTISTCVGCPSNTEVPGESSPTTGTTGTAATGPAGVTTPGKQTKKPVTPAVQSSPQPSTFATVPTTTISSNPTSSPSTTLSNGGSSLKGIHAVGLAMVAALVM